MTQGLASLETPSPAAANSVRAGRIAALRLTLNNFRNYEHARIETEGRSVVLSGENGAGKTNVLEALSYLVPGSGLRGAKLFEVGRMENGKSSPWAVAANIERSAMAGHVSELVSLGTGLVENPKGGRDKRQVHVDGEAVRTQASLAEHFSAHWLSPQMDRLFQGGAEGRRRFLDRLVFSLDPAHAGRTSGYMHALRERARLLKDGKMDDAWLSALEETMAAKGVAVAAARLDVAGRLAERCRALDGPFPFANLSIDGLVEHWLGEMPALEVEERIKDALKKSRNLDGQNGGAGGALEGRLAHQSDLLVEHGPKGQKASVCSTGEQKMLLVGLVLGAARMAADDEGRVAVLLLDEVAAHLDARHLIALFDEVADIGAQAWFTGTDAALFAPLKPSARFFSIDDGHIEARD